VFSVTVVDPSNYDFQWRRNGGDLTDNGNIVGSQGTILVINSTSLSDDGDVFDCVVTAIAGANCVVVSDSATLTVNPNQGNNCPQDLDGNGSVGLQDLSALLANYGVTSGATPEQGDFDGDGDIDLSDLSNLLGVYGATCPTQ
jgi:hypothetical protein